MNTTPAPALPVLPPWASHVEGVADRVIVDPDLAYPAMLAELAPGTDCDPAKPTKYWLEVAFQCLKLDLQLAMRKFGFTILIRGDGGRKDRWSSANAPGDAADVERATKGREAREHYRRLRGFLPS